MCDPLFNNRKSDEGIVIVKSPLYILLFNPIIAVGLISILAVSIVIVASFLLFVPFK